MSMLTFVIPTRGKQRQLSVAIKSIAEQVGEFDVNIVLLYNNPDSATIRVINREKEKYPFISAIGFDGEPDYADKFHEAFTVAKDSDWVWMFGNDDVLEPNALEFMFKRLQSADKELKFIHVAEVGRHSGSAGTYTGRMIDLCNTFGWIEFTGFNTGNIIRGPDLYRCAQTKHWNEYAKNAFVHSCALLEGLFNDQSQFIDLPLIRAQEDDNPELTKEYWAKGNTQARYLYLIDALELMKSDGLIKGKLPAKFFRYHNYSLWDRHITTFISEWINNKKIWNADWVDCVVRMAEMVKEDDIANGIRTSVNEAIKCVDSIIESIDKGNTTEEELIKIYNRSNTAIYPFTFVEKMEKGIVA